MNCVGFTNTIFDCLFLFLCHTYSFLDKESSKFSRHVSNQKENQKFKDVVAEEINNVHIDVSVQLDIFKSRVPRFFEKYLVRCFKHMRNSVRDLIQNRIINVFYPSKMVYVVKSETLRQNTRQKLFLCRYKTVRSQIQDLLINNTSRYHMFP